MKAPPADFDVASLERALQECWSVRPESLAYLPVGFGDHHWRADCSDASYFVTLTDYRLTAKSPEQLEQALQAVHALRLPFAIAALPTTSDALVTRVSPHYSVTLFPWLDAVLPAHEDPVVSAQLVAALHRAWRIHPVNAPREDFQMPHRAALHDALGALHLPLRTGPYAEPARTLLRTHASDVRAALELYDRWSVDALSDTRRWCLTHGEPGVHNQLIAANNRRYLVDWESARIAPPERDLAALENPQSGVTAYAASYPESPPLRPELIRLYQLWYALAETSVYILQFRRPHTDDANMSEAWRNFQDFLPTKDRWPELA